MIRSRIAASAFTLTLATAAIIAAPGRAHSATLYRTYDGTGWHIPTGNGIQYLGTGSWRIQFYDTTSRTTLTPYAKLTAANITKATGVTVTVTTTVTKSTTACPTGRTIIMRLTSTVTRSAGSQCHTATGAADGSRVSIATSNWTAVTLNGSHDIYHRKVVSHELGHSIGLGHPKTWTTNPSPLMRGDVWGGNTTLTTADDYTSQDINGLKALRANATKLRPPAAAINTLNGATTQ
ncbi:hypothetical protein [Streptomyces sp. NPDC005548]|uniref:hypothetical protein n=1 Tax=Streptomyces sp. NPDC005548 TaxID=3364724 RepID=UPI003699DF16